MTAQKRAENIQDVPISISVIRGDDLVKSGSAQLTDFAGYLPGLQVDNSGTPGRSTLSLRGIVPLGTNVTVGTYLDDAPLGSSSSHARASEYSLDLLPYDTERIEVLRGPQGTLYGASSIGGLIQIGSNTKAFTAAALAILVDEGKIHWDDKVVDHLPQFRLYDPYVTREVTIRDLLTHRSGLG
ncbi:MAG: TonB-dependent receptor plug domain-containing protein, partial [Gammaproteobacteria bacterium]